MSRVVLLLQHLFARLRIPVWPGGRVAWLAAAVMAATAVARPSLGQLPQRLFPGRTQRQVEDLRLNTQQLRTDVTGNRVSRQVEISRLQAQLERLEDRLQEIERRGLSSDLVSIVALLNDSPLTQPQPTAAPPQPAAAPPQPAAAPPAQADAPPAQADAPAAQADAPPVSSPPADPAVPPQPPQPMPADRKSSDALRPAEAAEDPASQMAAEDTAEDTTEAAAEEVRERREQLLRLLVGDYLLTLRVGLLDAHAELITATDQLRVLERFVAKGQATAGQLDLQRLKQQQAALQVARLDRQLEGLQRILPESLTRDVAALMAGGDSGD